MGKRVGHSAIENSWVNAKYITIDVPYHLFLAVVNSMSGHCSRILISNRDCTLSKYRSWMNVRFITTVAFSFDPLFYIICCQQCHCSILRFPTTNWLSAKDNWGTFCVRGFCPGIDNGDPPLKLNNNKNFGLFPNTGYKSTLDMNWIDSCVQFWMGAPLHCLFKEKPR